MKSISTLLQEINSLPKGDIYQKTIKGNVYYYHQYFEDGKRITNKIADEQLNDLQIKIARRKELEKELKVIRLQDKGLVTLSKTARDLSGYVMSGNSVVAEFDHGQLVKMDEKRAPLIIKRTHSLVSFLKTRVIDSSRVNSRLLKKALNIHEEEESFVSLFSYAQSISDNFWFKPKHSKVNYENVCFNNDIYFDIALKGDMSYFPSRHKITPELTTVGSYEKGWKKIDSHWWLYKQGTKNELFSELFSSAFAELMGINTVKYYYEGGFIKCQNFAEQYNFEPLISIAGDDDRFENTFPLLNKINPSFAVDFIKLLIFDCVVNNVDRHNENTGLLRDKKTGAIVALAPNFDNNLSLIGRSSSLNMNPKSDGLIKLFVSFLKKNKTAKEVFKNISLKEIRKDDITTLINTLPLDVSFNSSITDYVYKRYEYLRNLKTSF